MKHASWFLLVIGTLISCSSHDDSVRTPVKEPSPAQAPPASPAGLDIGAAIERVRHALRPDPADAGRLVGSGSSYLAHVDAAGISVLPAARVLDEGPDAPLRFRFAGSAARFVTEGVFLGARDLLDAPLPAVVDDRGHAVRGIGPSILEDVVLLDEGVEQTWHLDDLPDERGDLVIRISVSGMELRTTDERGVHFADPGGDLGVWYSGATITDAADHQWTAPAEWSPEDGQVVLRLPEKALEDAVLPLVVDPTIGPELTTGQPLTLEPAPSDQVNPAVASNGTDFLVVWRDLRPTPSGGPHLYGTRVSQAGAVLDPSGIEIAPMSGNSVSIAYGGGVYSAVYNNGPTSVTRIDSNGAVLGTSVLGAANSSSPDVAWSGAQFMAAWSDFATGIRGARFSASGTVADPGGFLIDGNKVAVPRVAGSPIGQYLVVWPNAAQDIVAVRVPTSGGPLDAVPFTVGASTASGVPRPDANPDVAWDGFRYFLVWDSDQGFGFGNDIWGDRVDTNGNIQDPGPGYIGFTIATFATNGQAPRVASTGAVSMVTYAGIQNPCPFATTGSPRAKLVDPDGTVHGTASGPSLSLGLTVYDKHGHEVAASSSRFLVAVAEPQNIGQSCLDYDIKGSLLDDTGALLPPGNRLIGAVPNQETAPALGFDGANYLAVWADDHPGAPGIWGTRISPAGTILDPSGLLIYTYAGGVYAPALAFDGARYLVAWQTRTDVNQGYLYAARVNPQGTVLDPAGVLLAGSVNSSNHKDPTIAFDGTQFLVAWSESIANIFDIYAARVTSAGILLDPGGFPVSTASKDQLTPAAASSGAGVTLIVWTDGRNSASTVEDIYGARVDSSKNILDPSGIQIGVAANAQVAPAVAFGGGSYMVTWQDERAAVGSTDIYAARVSPMGALLDPSGIVVSAAAQKQSRPAIAFVAGHFFLTWDDARALPNPGTPDLYSARLIASGTLVDAAGIVTSQSTSAESSPALVAGAGSQILLAYESSAQASTRTKLRLITDDVGCLLAAECPDDGVACTTATCASGACSQVVNAGFCLIGGACYGAGAKDPMNECAACAPATSQGAFSNVANGTACATDALACTSDECQGGVCSHVLSPASCLIAGQCVAGGATNPINDCESCQPVQSAASWSVKPDGAACTADSKVCTADLCQAGACGHPLLSGSCLIAGTCYASGAMNPSDPCQTCSPGDSAVDWTPVAQCGSGGSGGATTTSTGGAGGQTTTTSSAGGAGGQTTTTSSAGGAGGQTTTTSSAGGAGGAGGDTVSGGAGGDTATGGSGTTTGPDACVPGAQVECACPGGGAGVQVCKQDATGYEPCTGCRSDEPGSAEGCGCRLAGDPAAPEGSRLGLLSMLAALMLIRRKLTARRSGDRSA